MKQEKFTNHKKNKQNNNTKYKQQEYL